MGNPGAAQLAGGRIPDFDASIQDLAPGGELLKVRAEGESLRKRAAAGKAIHNTELAGARLQTALDQLETEHLGSIKHQIPKTFPALAHLYPPEILAAERVQSWLGADEFLLAYHV